MTPNSTIYALLLILCGLLAHPIVQVFQHVTLRFAEVLK